MRAASALLIVLLASTALAGCLGGGDEDLNSSIPRAIVKVSEVGGNVDTFLFDASDSTGRGLKFEWDFDDGETSNERKLEHTFVHGANFYSVTLTITDTGDISDVWEKEIKVGNGINLPPTGLFKPSTRYLAVGEALTVDARATTDPEGDPIRYEWDFNHLMTQDEYLTFRDAKMNADYEDSTTVTVEDEDDGTAKSSQSPTLPTLPDPHRILSGDKDAGHAGHDSAPAVSLFMGLRSSEEPVFTLDDGFPDPTTFYVRLVALDVKGAAKEILSEEIWPVKVVDVKKPLVYGPEETSGTFQLGSPATVQEATPNNEETGGVFDDDLKWTFDIPDPIDLMFINVTWSQSPAASALPSDIDMSVESPNGKVRDVKKADTEISLELTRFDEMDTGATSPTWAVELFARSGVDIQYTLSYWAKVDLNPFRAIEAPYVVDDAPRDGET